MSDQNERDAGTKSRLSLRPAGGRLELGKTVDAGSVRQSFSHGRSKTVQVEVVKKRVVAPGAPRPAAPGARARPPPPRRRRGRRATPARRPARPARAAPVAAPRRHRRRAAN